MLQKKLKIGNRGRTEQIFEKGRRINGRFFQLRFLLNKTPFCRFALILRKGTVKTAVLRNQLRRRVYEAVRRNLEHAPRLCYDVVVLISTKTAKASYADIEKDIVYLLRTIR